MPVEKTRAGIGSYIEEHLRVAFDGVLWWFRAPNKYCPYLIGTTAGSYGKRGYGKVKLKGYHYGIHRVVAYLDGKITEEQLLNSSVVIDHIDGDPSNNLPSNLRVTDTRGNLQNRKEHRSGKTPNVTKHKSTGKWQVAFRFKGERYYVGVFSEHEVAVEEYNRKMEELNGNT